MTAHIRSLFGIIGGGASGVLIALAIAHLVTPTTVGVCVAIVALCVIGIFGCKAVETDKRRAADKARHPASAVTYNIEDVFAMRSKLWDERPDPMELFDRMRYEQHAHRWNGRP